MIAFEEAKQFFSGARMQKYLRACGSGKFEEEIIKSTNPEVCRSRDFRVLRLQKYNNFLKWQNFLTKK